MKPDLASPGYYVYSACAGNGADKTCKWESMAGTSMATPVTAGNAALLRDYFASGVYAADIRSKSLCPDQKSGSLYDCTENRSLYGAELKSLLIHSTVALTGVGSPTNVDLPYPPDISQGFGGLNLNAHIDFWGNQTLYSLFVKYDTVNSNSTNTYYLFVDEAKGNQNVVATLTWMDPPVDTTATKFVIHDLDITIQDPKGNVHYANGHWKSDTSNNVEKIVIPTPLSGNYFIYFKYCSYLGYRCIYHHCSRTCLYRCLFTSIRYRCVCKWVCMQR